MKTDKPSPCTAASWGNRNSVAHGEGSSATLEEVKRYYEGGHVLLDYFKDALWIEDTMPAPIHG